jgi:hypothetical protein
MDENFYCPKCISVLPRYQAKCSNCQVHACGVCKLPFSSKFHKIMNTIASFNYVDMENDPKPNICELFQASLMINGKYNNAAIISIRVLILAFFGPLYALIYSIPASVVFGIMASCDTLCCLVDTQALSGALQLLSMPVRLLQTLIFISAVLIFNFVFWIIMIVPIYILTLSWSARMLFYWTLLHNTKAKIMRKRISALYTKEDRI